MDRSSQDDDVFNDLLLELLDSDDTAAVLNLLSTPSLDREEPQARSPALQRQGMLLAGGGDSAWLRQQGAYSDPRTSRAAYSDASIRSAQRPSVQQQLHSGRAERRAERPPSGHLISTMGELSHVLSSTATYAYRPPAPPSPAPRVASPVAAAEENLESVRDFYAQLAARDHEIGELRQRNERLRSESEYTLLALGERTSSLGELKAKHESLQVAIAGALRERESELRECKAQMLELQAQSAQVEANATLLLKDAETREVQLCDALERADQKVEHETSQQRGAFAVSRAHMQRELSETQSALDATSAALKEAVETRDRALRGLGARVEAAVTEQVAACERQLQQKDEELARQRQQQQERAAAQAARAEQAAAELTASLAAAEARAAAAEAAAGGAEAARRALELRLVESDANLGSLQQTLRAFRIEHDALLEKHVLRSAATERALRAQEEAQAASAASLVAAQAALERLRLDEGARRQELQSSLQAQNAALKGEVGVLREQVESARAAAAQQEQLRVQEQALREAHAGTKVSQLTAEAKAALNKIRTEAAAALEAQRARAESELEQERARAETELEQERARLGTEFGRQLDSSRSEHQVERSKLSASHSERLSSADVQLAEKGRLHEVSASRVAALELSLAAEQDSATRQKEKMLVVRSELTVASARATTESGRADSLRAENEQLQAEEKARCQALLEMEAEFGSLEGSHDKEVQRFQADLSRADDSLRGLRESLRGAEDEASAQRKAAALAEELGAATKRQLQAAAERESSVSKSLEVAEAALEAAKREGAWSADSAEAARSKLESLPLADLTQAHAELSSLRLKTRNYEQQLLQGKAEAAHLLKEVERLAWEARSWESKAQRLSASLEAMEEVKAQFFARAESTYRGASTTERHFPPGASS